MGQTIKEVDHIANEQCKLESREYQWIIDKEEEGKNTITEHVCMYGILYLCTIICSKYSEFVENMDSATSKRW